MYILWAPYLALLTYLFKSSHRRIFAIVILIVAGSLDYHLPVYPGFVAKMFEVGLLWCLTLFVLSLLIGDTKKRLNDKILWRSVLVFYLLLSFSFLVNHTGNIPVLVYRIIDFSLLFFLVAASINDKDDIYILLNGLVFTGSIVALVGILQFILHEPSWGLQASYSGTEEVLKIYSSTTWRVASTSSNPNAFGTSMVMTLPLSIYLFSYSRKKITIQLLILMAISLQVGGIIISGCRASWIAFAASIIIWILFIALQRGYRHNKRKVLLFIALLGSFFFILGHTSFLSDLGFLNRLQTLWTITGIEDVGRREYHWIRTINAFEGSLFVIGKGTPGTSWQNAAHNNILAILFLTGVWGLAAYLVIFLKSTLNILQIKDKILSVALFVSLLTFTISGLSNEVSVHVGPNFILWPIIGILARKTITKELSSSAELTKRSLALSGKINKFIG